MYGIYSFLLFVALLVYFPGNFLRTKIGKKENLYLRERLGMRLPTAKSERPSIWIHAVSVGEVLSLRRLIAELKAKHPSWPIYLSTLTSAGYRVARQMVSEVEEVLFVPLDFGWVAKRFFSALRPRLFVLAESEYWPNLLRQARRSCRFVILINGRISERSYQRYCRMKGLVRPVLNNIDQFLVQTEKDRDRLECLGVPHNRIEVAGNLKADILLPEVKSEEKAARKAAFGLSDKDIVIVAGSTHQGEEEIILRAFAKAKKGRPDIVLVMAPRHPERAAEVEKAVGKTGLRAMRRTLARADKIWDVLILDTLGELAGFYALADLAFVGGSLVPHGGQNLLEPAYYAKPICFGKHMENFAALADDFVRLGAARVVEGAEDLETLFRMEDPIALEEMGRRARERLSSLQGATTRALRVIESRMQGVGE